MRMKQVDFIVDLQFGSCGKGLLAGYLAEKNQPDTVVMAFAPNAGHTYIDASGRKFVNIALPNGIVSKNLIRVLIGPGSIINPQLLLSEMEAYADLLEGVEIMIHEHAAIVTEGHRMDEAAGMVGIGSTMKGCGAALIEKIRRHTGAENIAYNALRGTPLEALVVDRDTYNRAVDDATVMQVEGAQGFSLGINSGFYPYTTSRECTIAQLMSDCALPMGLLRGEASSTVWGVCRTYPIRVANRFKDGHQVGYSGPSYPDQSEIEWADIGIEPELTTVTKLPRRVFTFSMQQIEDAVRANGCDKIFLNFANYITPSEAKELIDAIEMDVCVPVALVGHGPTVNDVEAIDDDMWGL